jgi:hypothetical protein
MKEMLSYAALAVAVLAAVFGIRAATVHVRNNIDEFINDIHRQSWWTTLTAITAAGSVILQAIEKILG